MSGYVLIEPKANEDHCCSASIVCIAWEILKVVAKVIITFMLLIVMTCIILGVPAMAVVFADWILVTFFGLKGVAFMVFSAIGFVIVIISTLHALYQEYLKAADKCMRL